MEMVACACGCGTMRPKYDKKGREKFYLRGHQNRQMTDEQKQARLKNLGTNRPSVIWNRGITYVHGSKRVYANKGGWNKAMRRLYPNKCMICSWDKASCDTHHIQSKASGGKLTVENGVILCPNCHRLVHAGIIETQELLTVKAAIPLIGRIV